MFALILRSLVFLGLLGFLLVPGFGQQKKADRDILKGLEHQIEQGNFQAVERPLLDFVIGRPNSAEGFELLARLRLRQQRLNEARSLYEKVLSIDPTFTRARIDLAVTTYYSGDVSGAQSQLKLIDLNSSSVASDGLRLAQALVLVRDFETTLKVIDRLPAAQRTAALPLSTEANLGLGKVEGVRGLIAAARSIARSKPDTAIGVANAIVQTAFNKEAAEISALVLVVQPRNVRALLLLARSKLASRDVAAARISINKAIALSPDVPDALVLLAMVEAEQDKLAEATKAIERALELAPSSAEIMTQAVTIYMRANKSRRAHEIARQLISLLPDDPNAVYLLGAASLQAGRIEDAEAYLGRYVGLRPDDGRGCVAYSLALAAQPDKLDAARRRLEGCLKADPRNFEATYQLALSYRSSGDTTPAIDYLERTVELAPNYAYAVRDLGVLYLQTGNESKARIRLEYAVKLLPDDADTHFQLSRLYNLSGQPELAKQHFERFQKLRGEN